jgi:hypothetical protein
MPNLPALPALARRFRRQDFFVKQASPPTACWRPNKDDAVGLFQEQPLGRLRGRAAACPENPSLFWSGRSSPRKFAVKNPKRSLKADNLATAEKRSAKGAYWSAIGRLLVAKTASKPVSPRL